MLARDAAGARRAVRHLIAYGHRRIAFLGERPDVATTRERRRGYLSALETTGLRPFVIDGLRGSQAAEAATRNLFRRPRPPTALFTGRNLITIGAVRALRLLGRHRDAALVGFDDFPLADLLEPAITVVTADPAAMGHAAARALFERIDGDMAEPREISIATTLIPRGSGELRPGVRARGS